jgi:hypothetical protein
VDAPDRAAFEKQVLRQAREGLQSRWPDLRSLGLWTEGVELERFGEGSAYASEIVVSFSRGEDFVADIVVEMVFLQGRPVGTADEIVRSFEEHLDNVRDRASS